jgi:NNP family nitrate/nitrite transporter-like MFS transporter
MLGRAQRAVVDPDAAAARARRLSRALLGITGAVGAAGGVVVNLALRQSFLSGGTGNRAYIGFIVFYAVCVGVVWTVYVRPSASSVASSVKGARS